jgi:polysaccharide pyruvyl transferase WcaK-like protein
LFIPFRLKQNHLFGKFIQRNIKLTKVRYDSFQSLEENAPKADLYLTGSDQVWNSNHNQGVDRAYFLDFVPESLRKVSYAASFGKMQLDDTEIDETKQLVGKYRYISVREKTGVEILSELGRRDAIHVVDPTLLLNREDWTMFMKPNKIKEKYLLIYMLEDNKRLIEISKYIARNKGLKIVKVGFDIYRPKYVDILVSHKSPNEFLTLFANADFVVTNSFHGTTFSVNFNRQFISVATKKYNTRLSSFLDSVGLASRLVTDNYNYKGELNFINYQKVNILLEKERNKSKMFLEKALDINEK